MLLLIVATLTIPAFAWFLFARGKMKSIDRRGRQVEDDIRTRLQSIAAEVGGEITAGPELRSSRGRLALLASKAPQILVIDVAKFTASLDSPGQLTIVPVQDAAKVIHAKVLHPVTMNDPAIDEAYKILASDESLARRVVTPGFVEKLRALDRAANVRSRLQVSATGATLLAARGLASPDELKAFHDGCAAVVDELRARLAG
jgi:hypothetical protein